MSSALRAPSATSEASASRSKPSHAASRPRTWASGMISPSGRKRPAPATGWRCHGAGRAARSSTPRLPMNTWFAAYVRAASQSRRWRRRYSTGSSTSRSTRSGFEPSRTKLGTCARTSETARITGIPFGVIRGISMDRPQSCQVGPANPQCPIARRREAERRFERAGEVRLIGEPRIARHLDEWPLLVDALACEAETSHEQITVGARAEHDPELPGQVIARQARDRLELRRMHDASFLRVEELSCTVDRGNVDASRDRRLAAALFRGDQSFSKLVDQAGDRQRLQRGPKGLGDGSRQSRVRRDGLAHERQGEGSPPDHPERPDEVGGLYINDAVAEAVRRASPSIVDLVRIEHDDLAACADPRRAPVVEDLDAAIGDADRVRVVAVLLIDLAGQRGAEELDTFHPRPAGPPAPHPPPSPSF